jgi:hypothetical protein
MSMGSWNDVDAQLRVAQAAANRHESAPALAAIDAALELVDAMPASGLARVAAILRQGLANARDGVWAMLYDQAWLDLDLVHALPACLALGAMDESTFRHDALDPYLSRALEPFKGRMQRAI